MRDGGEGRARRKKRSGGGDGGGSRRRRNCAGAKKGWGGGGELIWQGGRLKGEREGRQEEERKNQFETKHICERAQGKYTLKLLISAKINTF